MPYHVFAICLNLHDVSGILITIHLLGMIIEQSQNASVIYALQNRCCILPAKMEIVLINLVYYGLCSPERCWQLRAEFVVQGVW